MTNERIGHIAFGAAFTYFNEPHDDAGPALTAAIEAAIREALEEAFSEPATPEMQIAGFNVSSLARYLPWHDIESVTYKAMCTEKRKEWLTARPSTD